ncbi:family 43 glycosylhydrolase [Paraflavitalea speifideaquila]|uniref:family 43 glycosylhydrolase n=1 Tax=Paraflavitalea speifideaquila TaxID=3076558 RepID=UPI0028EE1BBA|nr:family 43 glycosylhydrolase [Paraflavitalea speifideiaquila]
MPTADLRMKPICLIILIHLAYLSHAQKAAPKPLFRDPVYDGAADPVVIWNPAVKKWWMFYTNRRATMTDSSGVQWVHGTRIGIAESKDGIHWIYKDTANINYRPDAGYTFWAPDIIAYKGAWHMYLTYVPGIFDNWNHPRHIVHCTSKDLLNWTYESTLPLVNDKVIDASVFALPNGGWRMWYNNERDGKSIFYADSKDLYHWEDKGKAIAARGEGPKVFAWKEQYWMVVDVWKGMEIYSSTDLLQWKNKTTAYWKCWALGPKTRALAAMPMWWSIMIKCSCTISPIPAGGKTSLPKRVL